MREEDDHRASTWRRTQRDAKGCITDDWRCRGFCEHDRADHFDGGCDLCVCMMYVSPEQELEARERGISLTYPGIVHDEAGRPSNLT